MADRFAVRSLYYIDSQLFITLCINDLRRRQDRELLIRRNDETLCCYQRGRYIYINTPVNCENAKWSSITMYYIWLNRLYVHMYELHNFHRCVIINCTTHDSQLRQNVCLLHWHAQMQLLNVLFNGDQVSPPINRHLIQIIISHGVV